MILNITVIGSACLARWILIDGWPLGPRELRSIVARGRQVRRWHRLAIWCIISFSVVVVLYLSMRCFSVAQHVRCPIRLLMVAREV